MTLRLMRLGYPEAFRHISLLGFLLFVPGTVLFASVVAITIAMCVKSMAITLTDDHIEGRNYWGLKRRIPLTEIAALAPFNSGGINVVVVSSKHHGKIYISVHTANLEELLELLTTYLPKAP